MDKVSATQNRRHTAVVDLPPARLAATMRPISLSSNNGLSIGACLRIPARQTPLFKFLLATFIPSHFLLFLCGPPSTGPYYGLLPSVRPSVRLINPEQKGGKYFKFGGNIPRCTCNIFEQKGA